MGTVTENRDGEKRCGAMKRTWETQGNTNGATLMKTADNARSLVNFLKK